MKTKIDSGIEIRDKIFKGNPFAQLAQIREVLWALCVLNNHITFSTQEETTIAKEKAQLIIDESNEINKQIEEFLKPVEEVAEEVEQETL